MRAHLKAIEDKEAEEKKKLKTFFLPFSIVLSLAWLEQYVYMYEILNENVYEEN